MRRPPESLRPPRATTQREPQIITDLRLRVITAMFGGGVEPGIIDGTNSIRPSTIRGALRFWWRACNARGIQSLDELFQEESRIWGAAATEDDAALGQGAIMTTIRDISGGTEADPSGLPPYAVFPFLDPLVPGRQGTSFSLRLTISPGAINRGMDEASLKRAARQALWGWITFGGIGARTRRGCGSLQIVENHLGAQDTCLIPDSKFVPNPNDLAGWLNKNRNKLVDSGNNLRLVPSLDEARLLIGPSSESAITAWHSAVGPMRRFRQEPGVGRNEGGGDPWRPGQSRWPEPGAVRGLGGIRAGGKDNEDHAYRVTQNPTGADFPRADLGMPILFQNMRGKEDTPALEGESLGFQRMASPVILKTVRVGNRYYPIALVLDAPHLWDEGVPPVHLRDDAIRTRTRLQFSPMTVKSPQWPFEKRPPGVSGAQSARDAFINYLRSEQGWTEVWQ